MLRERERNDTPRNETIPLTQASQVPMRNRKKNNTHSREHGCKGRFLLLIAMTITLAARENNETVCLSRKDW